MVGQRTLNPFIMVRIHVPQLCTEFRTIGSAENELKPVFSF